MALTADGKDIVCCEEVVVIDGHNAIIFPPAVFAENKILANPTKHRFSYDQPMKAETLRLWLSSLVNNGRLEQSGQGQFFAEYRMPNKLDKTRFITDIRYCPDPLPEGGVKIDLDF